MDLGGAASFFRETKLDRNGMYRVTKILPANCFGPYGWFSAKISSYCATDEQMRGQSMRSRDQTGVDG